MIRAAILGLCLVFSASAYGVAVDEKPLADPAMEATARALMKEIRCLVCQNQSIEDSNADLAKDIRILVRERIAAGDTPETIRAFLVDRYGDWVLLEPPLNHMTFFLWVSPFLILLLVAVGMVASRKNQKASEPLNRAEKARLKRLMKKAEKQ